MFDFLVRLFDTTDFPQRWHCGNWSDLHGWTHIFADLAIFGAYTAIPCVLVYFILRRRDVPFLPIVWLFALFILSCGFGHLVESTIFWRPWYRFSGLVKVVTALVSWGTVVALIPVVPKALALRTPEELEREIAVRKQAEKELEESLHEKEVLLKEIHHRVKNNLAVISSLFYLQSTYTQDQPTINILQESQDRVRSMAMVHEALYRSENLAAVEFDEYAQVLSEQLLRTYSLPTGKVQLKTDLEPVTLSVDLAVPCGLILNELVSNALKHAFPSGQAGEVRVSLHKQNGHYVLQVSDTGAGLPAGMAAETSPTLGLRLIHSLTRQIDAQFEIVSTNPGTEARLTLRKAHAEHLL